MRTSTQKIVTTALLVALTCVATMVIKIPSPLNGYINLGDCIVLLSAWMLPWSYCFLAAGLGSSLADLFSVYGVYAPATFVIKGLMALAAYGLYILLEKRINNIVARVISGIAAELVMILGYYIFEGFLYGFVPSLINIAPNAVQGALGLSLGVVLIKLLEKQRLIKW